MPRPVKGFQSEDGAFFNTAEAAELHESEQRLVGVALLHDTDPEALMRIIHVIYPEIERYIAACREAQSLRIESRLVDPIPGIDPGDDGSREADAQTKLEQPIGGSGSVPDLGDSQLAEAVANQGASDGLGSRRDDASGFLGGEDMATRTHPETSEARNADSD